MTTKTASQYRTKAAHDLDGVRDALKELDRIENGGAVNPNFRDPRAAAVWCIAKVARMVSTWDQRKGVTRPFRMAVKNWRKGHPTVRYEPTSRRGSPA